MNKRLINHVAFVIDASDSMFELSDAVVKVLDNQIQHLARLSTDLKQETRASIYFFGSKVSCFLYDADVTRIESIQGHYRTNGMTALIDANIAAIEDLKLIPEIHCDHSFVQFCLTDGFENKSRNTPSKLSNLIKGLGDNWTVSVLVPNRHGVESCERFGFSRSNIEIWDATSNKGVEEVGEKLKTATQNFMVARSQGIRSTKSLFTLDASNLTKSQVINNLIELSPREYDVIPVRKDAPIKEYVENYTKTPYTIGSGFYFLNKKETIQPNKAICIRNKMNGKVYSGNNARKLIGLPDYEVKVEPANHGDYEIFVKSSSVNRKLIKGTDLIIIK